MAEGRARWALTALLLAVAAPAHAQTINRSISELLGSIDLRDRTDPHAVTLKLGGGAVLTSRMDAGSNLSAYPLPFLTFDYRNILAVDETQARLNLVPLDSALGREGFRAGPMLRVDPGRGTFTHVGIAGLGKVPVSLEAGGFVSYGLGPARLRLRIRQDATEGHNGTVSELDLSSGLYKSGPLGIGMQVQTIWGSRNYMEAFYGVSALQAQQSRLPMYSVGAGFKDLDSTLYAEYKFARRWSMIGAVQYVRLLNGAAHSPITMTRGFADRANVGLFVVYTFGGSSAKAP